MGERARHLGLLFGALAAVLGCASLTPGTARAEAHTSQAVAACASTPDPAAELEHTLREALLAYRPPAETAGDSLAKDAMRFGALEAERVLLPHTELLRRHVRWALARLPHESLPDMSAWEHWPVEWASEKELAEAAREVSLRGFELLMFRDPVRALDTLRSMCARDKSTFEHLVRVRQLEAMAPPRLVWANDDVERPVLALVERREIFEVEFGFDRASFAYLPERITWAKRPESAAPSAVAAGDPAAAALRAFTDAVEAYDTTASADSPSQFSVKANAFAIEQGERFFAGKAEALHARAHCELLKRPQRTLPSTHGWQLVSHGDPPNTLPARNLTLLPLLKWEPARYFWTIRSTTRFAVEGAASRSKEILESMAEPAVVRTNDDLDNPSLATLDRGEIFVVSFHYDASIPGYAPTDIEWLRRVAR